MRISKTGIKRRAVSKAIANQEVEKEQASEVQLEAIRLKAYEFFVQRGCAHGHDVEDWQAAEEIVMNRKISV